MSWTFSTNNGSLESFKVSWRCGWSPNACQIRDTAVCVSPTSAAIDRVDQCVASRGVLSSVLVITASTCSSVIVRGRPGRGSSLQPVEPVLGEPAAPLAHRADRDPQLPGDLGVVRPSAAASTIRDRNASACALVRRRAHASNCARSSSRQLDRMGTGIGITPSSPLRPN